MALFNRGASLVNTICSKGYHFSEEKDGFKNNKIQIKCNIEIKWIAVTHMTGTIPRQSIILPQLKLNDNFGLHIKNLSITRQVKEGNWRIQKKLH